MSHALADKISSITKIASVIACYLVCQFHSVAKCQPTSNQSPRTGSNLSSDSKNTPAAGGSEITDGPRIRFVPLDFLSRDASLTQDGKEQKQVSIGTLQRLRRGEFTNPNTDQRSLISASYEAQLDEGRLVGNALLHVAHSSQNADYLLKPFSPKLANQAAKFSAEMRLMRSPNWFDRDGLAAFSMQNDESAIQVYWEQSFSDSRPHEGVNFYTLELPWAQQSVLQLKLSPEWQIISCNVPFEKLNQTPGQLKQVDSETVPDSHVWRLTFGGQTQIRFALQKDRDRKNSMNYLFASEQIDWILQSAGLEVTAKFALASTAMPDELELRVDPRLTIKSLAWDQQDVPSTFDSESRILRMKIPRAELNLLNQHRLAITALSNRLDDFSNPPFSANHALPSLALERALTIDGRGSVSLNSDWELENFSIANATITSRSGTTGRGGLGRIDFRWMLEQPNVTLKITPRLRQKKAESLTTVSIKNEEIYAESHIAIDPSSEIWNTLPITVPKPWLLESIEAIELDKTLQVRSLGNDSLPSHEIVFSSPVENARIELKFRFRCQENPSTGGSKDAEQFLRTPDTPPFLLPNCQHDGILDYVPSLGYVVAPTLRLVESKIKIEQLDLWQQSHLPKNVAHTLLRSKTIDLPRIQFKLDAAKYNFSTLTNVCLQHTKTAFEFYVFSEASNQEVTKIELQLPVEASDFAYRLLTPDGQPIQSWRLLPIPSNLRSDISENDIDEKNATYQTVSVPTAAVSGKTFLLESQFVIETQDRFRIPHVVHQTSGSNFLKMDSTFEVEVDSVDGSSSIAKLSQINSERFKSFQFLNKIRDENFSSQSRPLLYEAESLLKNIWLKPVSNTSKGPYFSNGIETISIQDNERPLLQCGFDIASAQAMKFSVTIEKAWMFSRASPSVSVALVEVQEIADKNTYTFIVAGDQSQKPQRTLLEFISQPLKFKLGKTVCTFPDIVFSPDPLRTRKAVRCSEYFALAGQFSSDEPKPQFFANQILLQPRKWADLLLQTDSNSTKTFLEIADSRHSDRLKLVKNADRVFSEINTLDGSILELDDQITQFKEIVLLKRTTIMLIRWVLLFAVISLAILLEKINGILFATSLYLFGTINILMDLGEYGVVALLACAIASCLILAQDVLMRAVAVRNANQSKNNDTENGSTRSISLSRAKLRLSRKFILFSLMLYCVAKPAFAIENIDVEPKWKFDPGIEVTVPVDIASLKIGEQFYVQERSKDVELNESGNRDMTRLLSARHSVKFEKESVSLLTQKAILTSVYEFDVTEEGSEITFPWKIADVVFDKLSVDGIAVAFGKNLRFDFSQLIYVPERVGRLSVELRTQLRLSRSSASEIRMSGKVIPCATATLLVDADLANLVVNGERASGPSSKVSLNLGKSPQIEMFWTSTTVANANLSAKTYEVETQLILDQARPLAITRFEGDFKSLQQVSLDWNAEWKPIGAYFNQVLFLASTPKLVGNRMQAFVEFSQLAQPLQNADASASQVEIYWRPQNETPFGLSLPSPQIAGLSAGERRLKLTVGASDIWSVDRIDSWPLVGSLGTSNEINQVIGKATKLLRIPDAADAVLILRKQYGSTLPEVTTSINYQYTPQEIVLQYSCVSITEGVSAQIERWKIDSRIKIQSIEINGTDAMFCLDKLSNSENIVSAFIDPNIAISRPIMIRGTASTDFDNWASLPTIQWLNKNVKDETIWIEKNIGMQIEFNQARDELKTANAPTKDSSTNRARNGLESLLNVRIPDAYKIGYDESNRLLALNESNAQQSILYKALQGMQLRVNSNAECAAEKIICSANLKDDIWTLRYDVYFKSNAMTDAICLEIPADQLTKIQFDTNPTIIGEAGKLKLLYLKRVVGSSASEPVGFRMRFDVSKLEVPTFLSPAISIVEGVGVPCVLQIPQFAGVRKLNWDLNEWQEMDGASALAMNPLFNQEGEADASHYRLLMGGAAPIKCLGFDSPESVNTQLTEFGEEPMKIRIAQPSVSQSRATHSISSSALIQTILWAVPFVLLIASLAIRVLRDALVGLFFDYPWRFTAILAMIIAVTCSLHWLALLTAIMSVIQCVFAWRQMRFRLC